MQRQRSFTSPSYSRPSKLQTSSNGTTWFDRESLNDLVPVARSSSITDNVRTGQLQKSCYHVTTVSYGTRSLTPTSGVCYYYSPNQRWRFKDGIGPGPTATTLNTVSNSTFVQGSYPVSTLEFNNRATTDWEFQFPATVSLPNFLIEVPDIETIWKTLVRLRGFGFRSLRDVSRFLGGKRGSGTPSSRHRELSGIVADSWLTNQFGIQPLIKDIQELAQIHRKFQRRLSWLKKNNGKTVTLRRRMTRSHTPGPEFEIATGLHSGTRLPINAFDVYTVGARLHINLSYLDSAVGSVAGMLHQLGFNRPAYVLYEATPFSFLIDYIANVGNIVKRYSQTSVFPGTWDILDGWTSTLSVEQFTDFAQYRTSFNEVICPKQVVGHWLRRTYSRSPGIPTSQGLLLNGSSLSQTQFANIAALIRQQL